MLDKGKHIILCRTGVNATIVKRPIVCHVIDDFINDVDEHLTHASGTSTMSSFSSGFDEIDAMFLEFTEELDNPIGGPSSVGDNSSREYIEVVKGDLQWFFVLDFNDQAINRFVEYQMLSTQDDCHEHFKKYNYLEEARAYPPHIL
ncbi:CACTA en-spm transposon protein [Cucumis melo var. makuwa]|uniref:CACTA en-spm transposon protein n=1 Tax=Cucumis melo var. makuwa TaxID=1194695 RepID=A0A5D3D8F4_CUCMM|nr:CACTA en-spm transposon protein [Cucumis melo var. makuwa]